MTSNSLPAADETTCRSQWEGEIGRQEDRNDEGAVALSGMGRIGRDVLVYGVGGVLAKAVAFFLIPVYTRLFSPGEYGQIELLTMIAALMGAVMNVGMDSAQSFFFFEKRPGGRTDQAQIVSAILRWRIFWGGVCVLVGTISAPLINSLLFHGKLEVVHFAVAFAGVAFSQVLMQGVELYRLLYQAWRFVLTTFAVTCLAAAVSLSCIIVLDMGILGFFAGQAMAAAVLAAVNWWLLRAWVVPVADAFPLPRRLWRFGVPLMPGEMAFFVLSTADRWVLFETRGDHELGIYSVAAKFALLIALVIETFRQAWWPAAMEAMHAPGGAAVYRQIARLYTGVSAAGIVILFALSPWLVRTFTAPAFHEAYPLVGVLAWSSVLYGFFMVGGPGIWKTEKTWITSVFMIVGGMVNIGLAWWWSSLWGAMGAALALVVAYAIWIMLTVWTSERLWKVAFPWRVMCLQVAAGAFGGWLVHWLHVRGNSDLLVWVISLALAALLLRSALDSQQRELVWRNLWKPSARS